MNISIWIKYYDNMGDTFYCNVSYVQDPTHFAFRNQGEGVSPGGGCLPRGCLLGGGVCPGGCLSRGSVFPGGCLPRGCVSAKGGVCPGVRVCPGWCLPGGRCLPDTPREQNDRCL